MLGRSQRLEDIYIVENPSKFDPSYIRVNEAALSETKRIHYQFEEYKEKEEAKWKNHFTVSYLNVNRLKPHLAHVKGDHMLMKSNALGLAETWLDPEDTIAIDGFYGSQINVGPGKGLASFIQNNQHAKWTSFYNEKCSAMLMETPHLNVIFLYLSQGFDSEALENQLEEWITLNSKVAIIGDVNIDYPGKEHRFKRFMSGRNFSQLVKTPTHIRGGTLDHIYVSEELLEDKPFSTQRSVYYSDHDVVVLHVPLIQEENSTSQCLK